ncbi:hypothetical protein YTPLAS72_12020 [Nitrospira sp.]|nr:hypothetical protein YTPLAS72_12020 [Nitrospira sp.]
MKWYQKQGIGSSGPKRNGEDRLYGERVPIYVDADVRDEYWENIRALPVQKRKLQFGRALLLALLPAEVHAG